VSERAFEKEERTVMTVVAVVFVALVIGVALASIIWLYRRGNELPVFPPRGGINHRGDLPPLGLT
jgi:hypothetical protein